MRIALAHKDLASLNVYDNVGRQKPDLMAKELDHESEGKEQTYAR